jgi:septum formation topological specificity factor MinE
MSGDRSLASLLLRQEQIIEELTELNKELTEVLAQYIEVEEEESK